MDRDANQPSGPLIAPERKSVRGVLQEREHKHWLRQQVKRWSLILAAVPPGMWAAWEAASKLWHALGK